MRRIVVGVVLLLGVVAFCWWLLRDHDAPAAPNATAATASSDLDPAQLTSGSATQTPAVVPHNDAERTPIHDAATNAFVVRGRVVKAVDVPYPGARLRAERFLGYTAEGTPDLSTELTCDAAGAFEWTLPVPTSAVCLRFAGAMPRHLGRAQSVIVARGDPPPQDIELFLCPLDCVAVGRVTDTDGKPIVGAFVKSPAERVACDTDGHYRAEFSSTYGAGVSAGAPGYVAERSTFGLDRMGEVRADFRLRRGLRVVGTVVDAQDAPVAGAAVKSFFMLTDAVVTGPDGRFELTDLDPQREQHSVYARAPGYVEAKVSVVSKAAPREVRLVMRRGARVEGRVFATDGTPVGGAAIYIGFSPSAYNRLDAVSQDDGSFVFPAVDAGEQTMVTTRRGLAPDQRVLQVPSDATLVTAEVRLQPAHFLAGRVRDDAGQPVANVRVSVLVTPPGQRGMRGRGEYLDVQGKTGADGTFRLDGLPAGRVTLELYSASHIRKEVADVEVVVQRAATISGRVVDAVTGQPVEAFRIRFVKPELATGERGGGGYAATWAREGKSFADPLGNWRAEGEQMEPGTVWGVEATAEGYAPARTHVVATLAPDPSACVLRMQRGATVFGRVLGRSTGAAIADATLTWFDHEDELLRAANEPYGLLRARSDATGHFELTNVPMGNAKLAVEAAGMPRHTEGPFPVSSGDHVERTILLADGARIRGQLVDAKGQPLADVRLTLSARRGQQERIPPAETRNDGSFAFAALAGGDYELFGFALRDGVSTCYTRFIAVERDQDLELRVTPTGTASVRGTIESDASVPDGTGVMLLPTQADGTRAAFRGAVASGKFELRGAVAGAYRLVMHAPEGRMGSVAVTLRDGETVETNVTLAARR